MSAAAAEIAVVLPEGERFSATGAGAISLLAHRMARAQSRYRRVVVGSDCADPFADVPFLPVRAARIPARAAVRYAAGIAARLAPPRLIEVHNRADLALALARRFPATRVALFVHNDPLAMRGLGPDASGRLGGFVAVSAYLAGRLREAVPRASVTVIANAIDCDAQPSPGPPRARLILFAGRLVADKGADGFVAACGQVLPRLPGWRAEMIGADRFGSDSPETPFLRRLRPAAAAAGVRLSGFQTHDAVLAAMARAAIIVVPSRWAEPFGLTALEAMACGAALVCSRRGGLPELVGDAALECDPDDPAGMAETLYALASDPGLRADLGARGLERARRFDTRLVAAALDDWRSRMLDRPKKEN